MLLDCCFLIHERLDDDSPLGLTLGGVDTALEGCDLQLDVVKSGHYLQWTWCALVPKFTNTPIEFPMASDYHDSFLYARAVQANLWNTLLFIACKDHIQTY